jgi:hypothetical protein
MGRCHLDTMKAEDKEVVGFQDHQLHILDIPSGHKLHRHAGSAQTPVL